MTPARTGRRFAALGIDAAFLLALIAASFLPDLLSTSGSSHVYVPKALLFTPAALLLALAVQSVLVLARGQTLGKRMMDLQIVGKDGDRAGWLRGYALRYLVPYAVAGLLPAGALVLLRGTYDGQETFLALAAASLLFAVDLAMLVREPGKSLHDRLAGTSVVELGR